MEVQQTAIRDITAAMQAEVSEGQSFEVQQTAIGDITTIFQFKVLEGQPFELQQTNFCHTLRKRQRRQEGVGTQLLELKSAHLVREGYMFLPSSTFTAGDRQRFR